MGSLKKGEWSCYRGGQFNGGRIVVMAEASLKTENGLEVVSLIEGEWSC